VLREVDRATCVGGEKPGDGAWGDRNRGRRRTVGWEARSQRPGVGVVGWVEK
jgi:hypothetical protein